MGSMFLFQLYSNAGFASCWIYLYVFIPGWTHKVREQWGECFFDRTFIWFRWMENLVRVICMAVSSAPSYCPMQYIVHLGTYTYWLRARKFHAYYELCVCPGLSVCCCAQFVCFLIPVSWQWGDRCRCPFVCLFPDHSLLAMGRQMWWLRNWERVWTCPLIDGVKQNMGRTDLFKHLSSIGGLALRFHWMESAQIERF